MTTTRTIPGISTGGATNPLKGLLAYGQSPWMDYIRRDLLIGGGLKKYIDSDGLRGMTSNPAIFEKAIAGSNLYNDILNSAEAKKLDANGIFEEIAIRDVQDACDIYEQVAEAFLSALEARAAKEQDVSHIASVASFFVSRIDTLVDSKLDEKLKTTTDEAQKALFENLQGKVAIANARLTYKKYEELFGGPRWKALAAKGAQTQRLLWASTSTKNPRYRDVIYVEELIGADTVDTIPPATFDSFRDHGKLRPSLTENVEGAAKTMADLAKAGISMKEVTDKLMVDGVKLFSDAFKTLLDAVSKTAGVPA